MSWDRLQKVPAFLRSIPFLLFLHICGCAHFAEQKPFLSRLRAGAEDALYATYAAAMERSEFTLDQGYEFVFYDPDKGIDFTTDTGGDICLAFKINGKWVYELADMHQPPVIKVSYPDLVSYEYRPLAGIKVKVTFLVQSSRSAVQDITIINEGKERTAVEVFPFMRHRHRFFDQVKLNNNGQGFHFTHEEHPDGWTLDHELPYEDTVQNIFLISEKPDKTGAFNSWRGEPFLIPNPVHLHKNPKHQVNGRALSFSGERYTAQPPEARLQVFLDKNQDHLLTERSPVWGAAQGSIDRNGFFRVALDQLEDAAPEEQYTFTYYLETQHLAVRYSEQIPEGATFRRDITLAPYDLPAIPGDLRLDWDSTKQEIHLSWHISENNILNYYVYRRDYPDACYDKISGQLENRTFTDENVVQGKRYGYIVVSADPQSGETGMHSREITNVPTVSFRDFIDDHPTAHQSMANAICFKKKFLMAPGASRNLRMIRTVGAKDQSPEKLNDLARELLAEDLQSYTDNNERLLASVPQLEFEDPDREMMYWSAFNMMRQVFYPPEAKSSYNYYVFSREPTWGWGHGGQVFHESIAMLAYAYMDPESAMNSQRVYRERQYGNGYINYRTGAYLDEIIEHNDQLTSSAPWYAWLNWEIYCITNDRAFLEEMYTSSKRFYKFYVANRDSDGDGLCEWGGHAILESVRDALVAVWDEVGWPANFEAVDLNSMLVMEARSLEAMALELGFQEEASQWKDDYETRVDLINHTFWDAENGFYYQVDKVDNDFTYKKENDLKRDEIIGFLPLWAGVADQAQAERLVEKLTDSTRFWRKYGIPSLSAADPYYNDKGYWNGPVWVQWNYLIMRGLMDYGYREEARVLLDKVAEGMILELKKSHNLWEFYSPDEPWAGYHKTYIWAGIINRMMMDIYRAEQPN